MLRHFKLTMPGVEPGTRRYLDIEAETSLYIPRLLHFRGLASYERQTLACFAACMGVAQKGAVFDIGGNVGVFSWMAAILGDRRVIAFEPFPALADTIESIAVKNGLAIEVERRALSEKSGTAEFFISNKSDCSHSLNEEFRCSGESIVVDIDTFDLCCQRLNAKPAIVKIDTETTEPAVLRGAQATIAAERPWILCEVLPGQEDELTQILAPLDYQWYRIGDSLPLERHTRIVGSDVEQERNWLFAPKSPDMMFWERYRRFSREIATCKSEAKRLPVDATALAFANRFETYWRPIALERFHATLQGENVELLSEVADSNGRVHFFHGSQEFDTAGPADEAASVEPNQQYQIELDIESRGATWPRLRLWVFQYDETKRIQSDHAFLLDSANQIRVNFDTCPNTLTIRIALQVTGPGSLILRPPRLSILQ